MITESKFWEPAREAFWSKSIKERRRVKRSFKIDCCNSRIYSDKFWRWIVNKYCKNENNTRKNSLLKSRYI